MPRKFRKSLASQSPPPTPPPVDPSSFRNWAVFAGKLLIGAIAIAGSIFTGLSWIDGRKSQALAKCQELRQVVEQPRAFLADFLIDPHVEDLSWSFHNSYSKHFGPESQLRLFTKSGGLNLSRELCPSKQQYSYINSRIEVGASVAQLVVTESATTSSIPTNRNSVSGDATSNSGIVDYFNLSPLDCVLHRANRFAKEIDDTNYHHLTDLAKRIDRLSRRKAYPLMDKFECRDEVPKKFCKEFQKEANYLISAAAEIQKGLSNFVDSCASR